MKIRVLLILSVFVLTACTSPPADVVEQDDVSRHTPLAALTVKLRDESFENRTWPTVSVFIQKGYEEQKLLVEAIGGVGEYPGGFEFSPDKKQLFINLESKLVAVDIATGEQQDVFISKKQVESYIFTDDGKKLIVWDQIYASQDSEYFIHEVDLMTGEARQLHQGDAGDGRYFFINKVRDDNVLLLVQAAGEAGFPWLFDLNTKELKPVPGHEEAGLYVGYSKQGSYMIIPDQMLDDACNDFMGSAPSVYAFIDPLTGEMVRTIGDEAMHTQIMAMSPDDSEVLYSEFEPVTAVEECDIPMPAQAFYRASLAKNTEPEKVTDYLSLFSAWAPERAGFEYVPLSEGGRSLMYYDQQFLKTTPEQSVVSVTTIQ